MKLMRTAPADKCTACYNDNNVTKSAPATTDPNNLDSVVLIRTFPTAYGNDRSHIYIIVQH